MGRYELCGSSVVLPTGPAWTFGGKRPGEGETPGPGAGRYGASGDWNAKTTRFGGPPGPTDRPWQISSAPYTGTRYLQPDYLTQNPKAPAWSFGQRHGKDNGLGPGVGTYSPNTNTFGRGGGSWGPPPRVRPLSAPRPRPLESPDRRKPLPPSRLPGATFKGKHQPMHGTDSPGPAYNPCCSCNCCDMCEKYKGWSFGLRPPRRAPDVTPAPNQYHVGCPTLGAAANGCNDALDKSYHKPTRRDHNHPW